MPSPEHANPYTPASMPFDPALLDAPGSAALPAPLRKLLREGIEAGATALRDPLPCWSVFTEGHVTHDGKLSACCFDGGDKWVMADLNQVPFMQGWNSEAFRKLRAAHLKKDVSGTICQDCVAYQG